MYANAPHASAAAPLSSPSTHHQSAGSGQVLEHGQSQGMPPAAPGGHYGSSTQASTTYSGAAATAAMTGAYQPSGDPSIDRMLRLEAACKRFGSLI